MTLQQSKQMSVPKTVTTPTTKLENHAIIKFCHDLGKKPAETLGLMHQTGRKSVQRSNVCRWLKLFKEGKEELTDLHRSGRKNTRLTLVDAVKDASLLEKYAIRRDTIRGQCCVSV